MDHPTLLSRGEEAQSILLVGAGGGFDIFSGLPRFFALRANGKKVHLANLIFSEIDATDARELGEGVHQGIFQKNIWPRGRK